MTMREVGRFAFSFFGISLSANGAVGLGLALPGGPGVVRGRLSDQAFAASQAALRRRDAGPHLIRTCD